MNYEIFYFIDNLHNDEQLCFKHAVQAAVSDEDVIEVIENSDEMGYYAKSKYCMRCPE